MEDFAQVVELRPGRNIFVRKVSIGSRSDNDVLCCRNKLTDGSCTTLQLIFCHGTCGSHEQYVPLLEALEVRCQSFKMIALLWDQSGCGMSPPPLIQQSSSYTNEETRADLCAIIEKYAVLDTPTILIGHSYATNIFLPVLKNQSNLSSQLKGCLLLGTAVRSPYLPHPDGGPWILRFPVFILQCIQKQLTESFLRMGVHPSNAKVIKKARDNSQRNDMRVAQGYYKNHQWVNEQELQCLQGISVLIVHGAQDKIIPVQCAQHLQNVLGSTNALLVVIDRASHLVMMEQPEQVADHVMEWLLKN